MMKVINVLLLVVFLPFYATAYAIAKLTKMKGNEDMPSMSEILEMI